MGTTKRRKPKGMRSNKQIALELKGQENWCKLTGVYFPVVMAKFGVPRR